MSDLISAENTELRKTQHNEFRTCGDKSVFAKLFKTASFCWLEDFSTETDFNNMSKVHLKIHERLYIIQISPG
jgi:thermostable 8-oxoguanine DNA glycosylase